jgi:hypothetical protein
MHVIRLSVLALVALLAGCGPRVIVMRNPANGELVQCKASTTGVSGMAERSAAADCAQGYQAAGWVRMN